MRFIPNFLGEEKDWQLIPQFSENVLQQHNRVSKKLAIQLKFTEEPRIQLSILSEILWISKKVWYETYQNLKQLPKIKGAS
jgi:hypothetical protein